jgi:hypothetical protein
LRKVLKQVQKPQTGWLDVSPATIGKADGTISAGTNGLIWVHNILNGQDNTVYNFVVPNRFGLQVDVGRRVDQPGLWQVKGALETFAAPAGGTSVPYHAEQHQFPHGDTLYINRKQIIPLTVLVSDAAGFIVQVYGSTVRTATGIARISTQAVDLSSYLPTTGAVYVSIESDDDGVLAVNAGTGFAAPAIATVDDIPVPAAGKYMIAFILLWEGMEELKDEQIVVPFPLATDYSGLSGHNHNIVYVRKFIGKTAAPTVDDDISLGYIIGDVWMDETNDKSYQLFDSTDGAAVWEELTGSGGSGAWGAITGTLSDQTDLQAELDGKADLAHIHTIAHSPADKVFMNQNFTI